MHSCLYKGWVQHRRHEPTPHEFRYGLFMLYLDLAELPRVFDRFWCWSTRRPALARFKRSDYHGDPAQSLDAAIRATVARETGTAPKGPIRLLTHLRYFGYVFNPVSFYYCFDAAGTRVETIVAEITNTPWKERHAYVLPASAAGLTENVMQFEFGKQFHVSPFWPMDMRYQWRLNTPNERLFVHMKNLRDGRQAFDATMSMERREISSAALGAALLSFPLMTAQVAAAIHWQALRLWVKRAPFYVHPAKRPAADAIQSERRLHAETAAPGNAES